MNNRSPATITTKEKPSVMPMRSSLLQRKCACGNSAGMVGECSDCQKKSLVQRQGIDRANTSESPPIAHEFPIQTKLTVGKPGDIYEQEADRVAAQVMSRGNSSPSIQPATTMREKEVQTKRYAGESPAGSNIESRLNSSKSGGSPLSDDVRSFMEPRFGADFSHVRVHTGGEAIQMNRELNAQAFTQGQDVYFGAGKTPANDGLTAHELTHVVQQTGKNPVSARVQRAIGDGHDLSSPCFQGDPILEACFDGEQNKYLRSGSSGDAVLKVQQALIALNNPRYSLPKNGADSKFGSETATAVSNFKIDNEITPSDGVVGQKTIEALDNQCQLVTPPPIAPIIPGLSEQDVADSRIDPNAQESLIRMSSGESKQQEAALGLLNAVKQDDLDGIIGESVALAVIDPQLSTFWAELPLIFQNVILVQDPENEEVPPVVVFRDILSVSNLALDEALEQIWLIQNGELSLPSCTTESEPVMLASLEMIAINERRKKSPIVCKKDGVKPKPKKKPKPPKKEEPEATSPSPGAIKALEQAQKFKAQSSPAIWYDSWGNDDRDNNINGKIDEQAESAADGAHYGKPLPAKICKSAGDKTDSCPAKDQSKISVSYKVCIDLPIESYKAAGISISTSRWIPTFFSSLQTSPDWTVWKTPAKPSNLLDGDIVAAANASHQHAGIVKTGLIINDVINLPGPTSAKKFLSFNPSGTNDIVTVSRVLFEAFLSIDFIARSKK
jgi:Domain of unknown function (DUF4157)/Putative peptidoglycan binding domain